MKCTRAPWLVSILGIILLGAAAPRAHATGLSQIKQIAAGENHTCALLADGTVMCWGYNLYGQLGNGTSGSGTNRSRPVQVSNLSNVVAIAAGSNHTCALLANGTVMCWGRGGSGQLGDGHTIGRLRPVKVTGLDRVAAIAAGSDHTCALLSDGKVKCWGRNDRGQLGDGTTADRDTPAFVKSHDGKGDLTDIIAIAAGGGVNASNEHGGHTCALKASGYVKCWGWNNYGQLGNGKTAYTKHPVSATYPDGTSLHNIVAIAAGGFHSCALQWDGQVRCWGRNNHGQVGDKSTKNRQTAEKVSNLTDAIAIAAGAYHSCAVVSGGLAKCWGLNASGQLGDGSTSDSDSPQYVGYGQAGGSLTGAVTIAAGGDHTCAVLSSLTEQDLTLTGGAAKCWGQNNYGQLGNNSTKQSSTPIEVTAGSSPVAPGATAVAAGDTTIVDKNGSHNYGHTCALLGDGTVKCWGGNKYGQLGNGTSGSQTDSSTPAAVTGLDNVVAISAGYLHTCALFVIGRVDCWGRNNYGQLGDGTTNDSSTPVRVRVTDPGAYPAIDLKYAVAISSGGYHTCALLEGGTVKCWGENNYGQLGNGTKTDSSKPVQVSNLTYAVAISSGAYHSCALLKGGTVKCWGQNNYGQLGNNSTTQSSTPVQVSNLSNAVAIAVGNRHTCALLSDGRVRCWGWNFFGQLGDGKKTDSSTPVEVSNVTDAVGLSAGDSYTCAVLVNGKAKCWGENFKGQLGNGNTNEHTAPVDVSGLTGAVAIAAGTYHTCALLSDGTVKCWGYNNQGQLGNGTTTDSDSPVSTGPLF